MDNCLNSRYSEGKGNDFSYEGIGQGLSMKETPPF